MNYPRKCVFHLTKNYAQATRLQMKHPLKESTKPGMVKNSRKDVAVGKNILLLGYHYGIKSCKPYYMSESGATERLWLFLFTSCWTQPRHSSSRCRLRRSAPRLERCGSTTTETGRSMIPRSSIRRPIVLSWT